MGLFRLVLALAVLETHLAERAGSPDTYGLGLVYGMLAVQVFFIISGFYMAMVLNEKYAGCTYATFLLQRILRLYPAYLLVLVSVVGIDLAAPLFTEEPFGALAYWRQNYPTLGAWSLAVYGATNLGVLGQDILLLFRQDLATGDFYLGEPPPGSVSIWCIAYQFVPPAWSLAAEGLFYLLAPFVVKRPVWLQGALLAASVGLRSLLWVSGMWDVHARVTFFFPSVLCFFLAGSIGYRIYREYLSRRTTWPRWVPWTFALLGLVILLYRRLPEAHGYDIVLMPFCAVMVPVLFAWTRRLALDRLIGELSYPVYLVHWQVILMLALVPGLEKSAWFEVSCIAVTLALAALVYFGLERRIDAWRARLFQKQQGVSAAPLTAAPKD